MQTRLRRSTTLFVRILLVAIPLAGCASIEGSQRPVLGVEQTSALVQQNDLGMALYKFGRADDAARGGLTKQAYRDMIVGIYMTAIDARYAEFRTNLSSESK